MSNDKFRETVDGVFGIIRGIPHPQIQVSYDFTSGMGVDRMVEIYQPSSDTWLILSEATEGGWVLQENLENGDITYHQDRVGFRKCINAMKKILGYGK